MIKVADCLGKEYTQCQRDIEEWFFIKNNEKSICLNELMEKWDISFLMQVIFENYSKKLHVFARHLKGSNALKPRYMESKRIAIYYYRFGKGGVERVLSYLLPLYLLAGYSVVLITDEEPKAEDYLLPPKVKRYFIPKLRDVSSGKETCGHRLSELLKILKEEKIDTLCYHAASSPFLFYDLVSAKSIGVKVIISQHELFSQYMVAGTDVLTNEINIFPLADMLTVLSREEEMFWKTVGVKSYMVLNPMQESYAEKYEYNEESVKIVWVGRLDFYQKQYRDIVPIMQRVVEELPDCIVHIYGIADDYRDQYLLETQIKESGLEKNVKYQGYCTDIEEIYKDAGVLLVTSVYESFSMTIMESKQRGIPLVTYSMPYLELLKNKKGFIEVEQGDILAAAKSVIKILSDKELRRKLNKEAKSSIENYSNVKIMESWKQIFSSCSEEGALKESYSSEWEDSYSTILKTLIFHQSLGCQAYNALRENYKKLRNEHKLNQIKDICERKKWKLALYPYGVLGKKIRGWLEDRHMHISLIVDNKLAGNETGILSVEELKKIDISSFLFIICSDQPAIYGEIRSNLYERVPMENIFDWFPKDEERVI